jgi:RNA-directed DNA polymerase
MVTQQLGTLQQKGYRPQPARRTYIPKDEKSMWEKGKPETFDFLGFTHYCSKSKQGGFRVKRQTSGKKFKQKIKAMKTWIRFNRHMEQVEFLKTIRSKLTGHYRYYGVTDNYEKMHAYYFLTIQLIYKWLNRRSQRKSFSKERFFEVLKDFKLPRPHIYVNIYDMSKR